MFRKPMRLEKWIAFDGAIGVETLTAVQDVDAEHVDDHIDSAEGDEHFADDPTEIMDVQAFAVEVLSSDKTEVEMDVSNTAGKECEVSVSMPNEVDYADFPYLGNSKASFSSGDSNGNKIANGSDFYLELTAPEGGSFGLWTLDQLQNYGATNFINNYGLKNNSFFAFSDDNGGIVIYRVINKAFVETDPTLSNDPTRQHGGKGEYTLLSDGGIRFHLTDRGYYSHGNGAVTTILRSLMFKATDPGSPPATVGGYDINVFYVKGASQGSDNGSDIFHGNSGGAYNPETEGVSKGSSGATTPEPPDPEDPDPPGPEDPDPPGPEDPDPPGPEDPDPPGPEDPDPPGPEDPNPPGPEDPDPPVDPTPPYNPDPVVPPPPPPGGDSGSGTDSGDAPKGEADGDSGTGEADGGDASGGGDDLVYIYRREDAADASDSDASAEGGNSKDIAAGEGEIALALEDKIVESAAAATAVELVREVESLLVVVQGEREVLLGSLSRLQEEYLRRGGKELGDLKDILRRLFESGNREKEAVNRIIGEMNRQMGLFHQFEPAYRDGMLTESLRELVDSAERRTGETGALSQAIDAVVAALARDGTAPSADEVKTLFERTYADSLRQWQAKADLADPMGKELAAAMREAAKGSAAAPK